MLTSLSWSQGGREGKAAGCLKLPFFRWQLVGPEIHSLVHSSAETSAQRLFRKRLAALIVLVYVYTLS